ncbi:soluble lytic murein transglycosylase, partial [Rhodanobacter sp. 115]
GSKSVARNSNTDWQTLQHHFHFSSAQRNAIRHAVVLFRATDFEPDSLSQLIALPAAAQSDATREWRVRVALAQQDWRAVLAGIEAMPAEQQNDDEWRYFRARALTELGHADTAQPLFQSLAGQATYFGFLAADRIGAPYAICPLQPTIDPQREPALLAMPGLQRAFELYAVDLPRRARREWLR